MGVGGSVQDSSEEFEVILEPFPGIILLLAFQGKDSQEQWHSVSRKARWRSEGRQHREVGVRRAVVAGSGHQVYTWRELLKCST